MSMSKPSAMEVIRICNKYLNNNGGITGREAYILQRYANVTTWSRFSIMRAMLLIETRMFNLPMSTDTSIT
jgi:hypothetical protein